MLCCTCAVKAQDRQAKLTGKPVDSAAYGTAGHPLEDGMPQHTNAVAGKQIDGFDKVADKAKAKPPAQDDAYDITPPSQRSIHKPNAKPAAQAKPEDEAYDITPPSQ